MPPTISDTTDAQRAYRQAYYRRNRQHILQRHRTYYSRHKGEILAKQRTRYTQQHPDWRTQEVIVQKSMPTDGGQWLAHCGVWQELEEIPHTCVRCQQQVLVLESPMP